MKFEFFSTVLKNTQIQNFMKIRPLGAELFHADGQTNMKKPTVIFHNFAKAPKDAKFQLVLSSQDNFILHCIYLSKSCDYFDNIRFNIQKFYVLPIPFVSHTHVHLHVALTRTKGRSLSTFQKKKSSPSVYRGEFDSKEVSPFFFNFQNSEGLGYYISLTATLWLCPFNSNLGVTRVEFPHSLVVH